MNDKMLELYKKAHLPSVAVDPSNNMPVNVTCFSPSKFAELIVRECMKMCDEVHRDYGMASDTARISKRKIKEHFGVTE